MIRRLTTLTCKKKYCNYVGGKCIRVENQVGGDGGFCCSNSIAININCLSVVARPLYVPTFLLSVSLITGIVYLIVLILAVFIVFTARRLAKRGICRRRVSVCVCECVCLSVCHTPVLYQNGKT